MIDKSLQKLIIPLSSEFLNEGLFEFKYFHYYYTFLFATFYGMNFINKFRLFHLEDVINSSWRKYFYLYSLGVTFKIRQNFGSNYMLLLFQVSSWFINFCLKVSTHVSSLQINFHMFSNF